MQEVPNTSTGAQSQALFRLHFKGEMRRIHGNAFAKMEDNIHSYVFICVNIIETNSSNAFLLP